MKISKMRANITMNEVINKGEFVKEVKVTNSITCKVYKCDGWEYTFFSINGELTKIEEYNHRELIEVYVA